MKFDPSKSRSALVRRVIYCTHKGRRHELQAGWHRHARSGLEMLYVDYGTMRLLGSDGGTVIKAGECIFVRGGVRHALESEAGLPFNYLNLMFCGSVPDRLFGKPLVVDRQGMDLVERMRRESEGGLPYQYDVILSCLTTLIIHLLRRLPGAGAGAPVEPAYLRHHHSDVVRRALTIITEHYAEPLTLNGISRAVGVSPSYLHVLLKGDTGETFTQLLHGRRVEMAKHMLLDSPMVLKQIIPAVGYHSPTAFFRVFKRLTGMTPAAYARSLGEPAQRA